MAKYVFAYKGGGVPQSEEEQQRVMAAWMSWYGELGPSIVDGGNPFGASKSVDGDGAVADGGPSGLTGYTVVSADSLDDAAAKAKGCPVLASGGTVEVYEAIEIQM